MTEKNNIFEENYSSGEEDESYIVDDDTCSTLEIENTFSVNYKIAHEAAVTTRKDFVLNLCSDYSFGRLVAGLSNGTVHILDINDSHGLSNLNTIQPCSIGQPEAGNSICGVKFVDESANNLLIGTTSGQILLYDLRTNQEQSRFVETAKCPKTTLCFDCNANSRIICTGTEQHNGKVYMLFFDVRQKKLLGGYFVSHRDDVTSVNFHATNPNLLCSGSTDGLINIFDISKSKESRSLERTINTESSVSRVKWYKNVYDKDFISCITDINDFNIYEWKDNYAAKFERSLVTESIRRKAQENCYLVNCHNTDDGSIILLAGTFLKKSEILRSVKLQNKELLPLANFNGNKQLVRDSVFNSKSNLMVTAGEGGIVTLWTPFTEQTAPSQSSLISDASKLKIKSNSKTNREHGRTPY